MRLTAAVRLVTLVALFFAATISHAAVISVNFNGGNGNTINFDGPSVTGTAGLVSAGNWNNAGTASGSGINVVNSAGASAGTLSFSVPNVYGATPTGAGTSGGPGDTALMTGQLDNFGNAGTFATVSGLGPAFTSGGYRVLVYQNADSAGSFGFSGADNAAHTDTRYGQQTGGNGSNYPLVGGTRGYISSTSTNTAGPGTSANVVILTGFNGSSFTLTGIGGTTGDGRPRPNGFQIESVPEPASVILFALGAAGLVVIGRRRRSAK